MAECYECGAYVAPGTGYRREVETGRSSNMSFTSKGRMRHSSGSRYGKRTICTSCAEAQDRADALSTKITGFVFLIIIAVCLMAYLSEPENPIPASTKENSSEIQIVAKDFDKYGFPCQLEGLINNSDWGKIRSGLMFSSGFEGGPIDVKWDNPQSGSNGSLRFLNLDRDNCITYELVLNGSSEKPELKTCKNLDGTLSIE